MENFSNVLNENKKQNFLSLKIENDDVIFPEIDNNEEENLNHNNFKENNFKIRVKYRSLIPKLIKRDTKEQCNKNEFLCNLLLMPLEIDLSFKISTYSLITYCYQINENIEQIYNITRKFIKNEDNLKTVDPIYAFHTFIRTAFFLQKQKQYIYSKYYINKALDKMKRCYELPEGKIKKAKEYARSIQKDLINYIDNSKTKFMEDEKFPIISHDIKELLALMIEKKYKNNDEDEGEYLYSINIIWLVKLKQFLESYINSIETNELELFFENSFEIQNIYCTYFDNKKEESETKKTDKTKYSAFPGPIDNYYITDFKDCWNDNINLDENCFIKKEMKLNEDYVLIKEKDWNLIESYFGSTNRIKRKKYNLDLIKLKIILFDERINEKNDNINLLKAKYLQINKNFTIKQLKDKIIRVANYNLEKYNEKNKDNDIKDNNSKNVDFFIINKEKSELLIEMCYCFVINNKKYDCIHIHKLNLKDENNLNELFSRFNKKKHLLIVEITNKGKPNFFLDLKLEMKNKYICSMCNKKIRHLNEKYYCKYCNYSLFCSKSCADESLEHQMLDKKLKDIFEKQFDFQDLLTLKLDSILKNNSRKGIVGLKNVGNTCYLNSTIQCLSNTKLLTKYFLNNDFSKEINITNTFGSKGKIAEAYYEIINKMWNENNQVINPFDFRLAFAKKNEAFYNNEQQDSQEFLLALLNNLSEDLNRVTNKKYMEMAEQKNGEKDEEASKRYWEYSKSRENSIIVDLFQGQFKSTITCLNCQNVSTTYDAYMNLQLPIPTKKAHKQIKFLTHERNCIDLNIKIDENIKFKNIIDEVILHLDKKKYIECLNNSKIKNNIFNYNNKFVPENILYDNIILVEFNNKFKMTQFFETSNLKNLQKNGEYKKRDNKNNENNIYNIFHDNKNGELVFFEKSLNFNSINNIDIFIYPTTVKNKGFLKISKFKILSYPIIISLNKNKTFKDLKSIIFQKFSKYLNEEDNNNIDSIGLYFPHFSDSWKSLKISSKKCPICQKNYDKNIKGCELPYTLESIISDIALDIRKKLNDNKRPIILFANANYESSGELYKGIRFTSNSDFKSKITIYDSLELFHKEEILDGEEKWFCNKCEARQKAIKKMEIYKIPRYLIIQFKRFKQRGSIMKNILGSKNDTFIYYNEVLNLSNYVVGPDKDNSIYELYGVILHISLSNEEGHYVSFCKNNGRWIIYNDHNVELCKNFIHKDAYLLFYERKDNN